jgi:hypothetical protein
MISTSLKRFKLQPTFQIKGNIRFHQRKEIIFLIPKTK